MPMKRPIAGQPLEVSAGDYRAFVDTVLEVRRLRRRLAAPGGVGDRSIITVKNSSGADQGRCAVMGIVESIILPSDDEPAFLDGPALEVDIPAAGDPFVVLAEPIADGDCGAAFVAGVCPVRLSVSDADHACADVADGETDYLASAESGPAAILWKEDSGCGEVWALIRFGGGAAGGESYIMPSTTWFVGTTYMAADTEMQFYYGTDTAGQAVLADAGLANVIVTRTGTLARLSVSVHQKDAMGGGKTFDVRFRVYNSTLANDTGTPVTDYATVAAQGSYEVWNSAADGTMTVTEGDRLRLRCDFANAANSPTAELYCVIQMDIVANSG